MQVTRRRLFFIVFFGCIRSGSTRGLLWRKNEVKACTMDNIVDSLINAYQDFAAAAASVLEAKEISTDRKTAATDATLENFKWRWEVGTVQRACDQAEWFVIKPKSL